MSLEDAAGWQANRLGEAGAEPHGREDPATGRADNPAPGMALGCSGCVELGYCRRGLRQNESLSDCNTSPAAC